MPSSALVCIRSGKNAAHSRSLREVARCHLTTERYCHAQAWLTSMPLGCVTLRTYMNGLTISSLVKVDTRRSSALCEENTFAPSFSPVSIGNVEPALALEI